MVLSLEPGVGNFLNEAEEPVKRVRGYFAILAARMSDADEVDVKPTVTSISNDSFRASLFGFEFEFRLKLRVAAHQWLGTVIVAAKDLSEDEFSVMDGASFTINRSGMTNIADRAGNLSSVAAGEFANWLFGSLFYSFVNKAT